MAQTKQALIVERDLQLATELKSLFRWLDYKVTTLQDAADVADTLGNRRYEVALVNVPLPEMTWRMTLRAMKNASRTTTVIMMTSSADEEDIRFALNSGAYIVLDRPLTQDQFTNLISPSSDGLFVVLRG